MVIFEKTADNKHVSLNTKLYNPMFTIEIFKICHCDPKHLDDLVESIKSKNWDLIFIIMMFDCPEEVIVEQDLREHILKQIFGYSITELNYTLIEEEIHHKHPNKHIA